jgi:hypothetical protein
MSIKNSRKIKKIQKHVHVVVLCDIVKSKNKNHDPWAFSWKSLHKYDLPQTSLLGLQGNLARVFAFEKENIRILALYLAGLCISPFPTLLQLRFCGLPQKMDFPFYQCAEGPNEQWFFVWSLPRAGCRKAPLKFYNICTYGVINFLGCLHILHFLDIQIFKFKFQLRVHQIHFKLFGGKYLEVWNPRNHACHTWAHRPPWHTQRPLSSWPTFEVLPKVAKQ